MLTQWELLLSFVMYFVSACLFAGGVNRCKMQKLKYQLKKPQICKLNWCVGLFESSSSYLKVMVEFVVLCCRIRKPVVGR